MAPSVDVVVTVRVKSLSSLLAGVIVNPLNSAVVNSHTPLPWLVPAESVAPVGTSEIVTLKLSEESVSTRLGDMVRAIAVSSLPLAVFVRLNVGVSATAITLTSIVSVLVAVSALLDSVEVTDTVKVKSLSSFVGGVMVKPLNWAEVNSHTPLPRSVPAERTAPLGTPDIVILLKDSVPSASTNDGAVILRDIAVSSLPLAELVTTRVGASATAVTLTSIVSLAVAVSALLPSVELTDTVRVKSLSSWVGGVMVRPLNSTEVNSHTPLPRSVPADRTAPEGTSEINIFPRISEPSESTRDGVLILSAIAVSSLPLAVPFKLKVGVSATAITLTSIV